MYLFKLIYRIPTSTPMELDDPFLPQSLDVNYELDLRKHMALSQSTSVFFTATPFSASATPELPLLRPNSYYSQQFNLVETLDYLTPETPLTILEEDTGYIIPRDTHADSTLEPSQPTFTQSPRVRHTRLDPNNIDTDSCKLPRYLPCSQILCNEHQNSKSKKSES